MVIRPASPSSASGVAISPLDWRTVFADGVPVFHPNEAYGAVLLYPEDDREIAELPAQPFVSDYLEDLGEQDREIGTMIAQAERVWIDNGDAVIASCVLFDKPREYQASVRHAAYAQRQAQQLWMQCAAVGRWEWLQQIRFVTKEEPKHPLAVQPPCDLIYHWVPYEWFNSLPALTSVPGRLRQALRPGGRAFVVGPASLREGLIRHLFEVCWEEPVEQLPTFRMHRTILPKARLKAGLTLYHVRAT